MKKKRSVKVEETPSTYKKTVVKQKAVMVQPRKVATKLGLSEKSVNKLPYKVSADTKTVTNKKTGKKTEKGSIYAVSSNSTSLKSQLNGSSHEQKVGIIRKKKS